MVAFLFASSRLGAPDAPASESAPTITGTTTVGQTLTCNINYPYGNGWSDSESYQWYRDDNGADPGSSAISGAINSQYTLVVADDGKYLKCIVTASNPYGSTPESTAYTAQIGTASVAPSFSVPATISGSNTEGTTATVSYTVQDEVSVVITWYRDADGNPTSEAAISPAENGSTYTVGDGDLATGEYYTVWVAATNAVGTTTSKATYQGPTVASGGISTTPVGYDAFLVLWQATARTYGARWEADPDWSDNSIYGDPYYYVINNAFYEPMYSYRRLADFLGGDDALEGWAQDAGDGFLDNYAVPNNYGLAAYYAMCEGYTYGYVLKVTAADKTAVTSFATNANYHTDITNLSWIENMDSSRPVAQATTNFLLAEIHCGAAHRVKTEDYMDLTLADVGDTIAARTTSPDGFNAASLTMSSGGHIEQWLGGYTTTDSTGAVSGGTDALHNLAVGGDPGAQGQAAFMIAKSAMSVIYYNEHAEMTGTHTGADNQAVLTDSAATYSAGSKYNLIGRTITNTTGGKGGTAIIMANAVTTSGSTVTGVLSGGQDWDTGDTYKITSLINSGTATQDARVVPKLKRVADLVWNKFWISGDKALGYRYNDLTLGRKELNNFSFAYFAWLFKETGYARYKQRADNLFEGAALSSYMNVQPIAIIQKQFNQIGIWAFDGLDWFKDGVDRWGEGS